MVVVIGLLFLILLGMAKSEQKNARFREESKRDQKWKCKY
jgi:hypothetical protein